MGGPGGQTFKAHSLSLSTGPSPGKQGGPSYAEEIYNNIVNEDRVNQQLQSSNGLQNSSFLAQANIQLPDGNSRSNGSPLKRHQ